MLYGLPAATLASTALIPSAISVSVLFPELSRTLTDTTVAAGATPIAVRFTPMAAAMPATSVPWPSSSLA